MADFDMEVAVYLVAGWAVVSGVLAYRHSRENFWENWFQLFAALIAMWAICGVVLYLITEYTTLVAGLIVGCIVLVVVAARRSDRHRTRGRTR